MKTIVLVLLFIAAALTGCTGDGRTDPGSTAAALAQLVAAGGDHLSAQELADWLIKRPGDFELVDIRETDDFNAGHIEGARHIPLATLFSEQSLASLPAARKIVVYSNGSAHAAQAGLLLRLTGREALALLGGYNFWQAYLNDPAKAGVAEMDAAERARYQAVACYFAGSYVADAGLLPKGSAPAVSTTTPDGGAADALGLGLGLGSGQVQSMELPHATPPSEPSPEDALGLGLGLGSDAVKSLGKPEQPAPGAAKRLLIRGEC
jgi:rhodanese-related sulfurtransferase